MFYRVGKYMRLPSVVCLISLLPLWWYSDEFTGFLARCFFPAPRLHCLQCYSDCFIQIRGRDGDSGEKATIGTGFQHDCVHHLFRGLDDVRGAQNFGRASKTPGSVLDRHYGIKWVSFRSAATIEKNDYNLNISRYISTPVGEAEIDLQETHAGFAEIEKTIAAAKHKHDAFLQELGLSQLP